MQVLRNLKTRADCRPVSDNGKKNRPDDLFKSKPINFSKTFLPVQTAQPFPRFWRNLTLQCLCNQRSGVLFWGDFEKQKIIYDENSL